MRLQSSLAIKMHTTRNLTRDQESLIPKSHQLFCWSKTSNQTCFGINGIMFF